MTLKITKAVEVLQKGGLVAFPTETVYGLGGDARNELAIRKIFEAKERPYDHPLIVHLSEIKQLEAWVRAVPPAALLLAETFWPGPLTIIFKKQSNVLDIVTGGQDTIGIRIPAHPVAQKLLREFGGGIAAPSANKFTHLSPTTSQAVQEELGDKVDLILEGGDCEVGLESTIIDMSGDEARILRPGMITAGKIAEVIGANVLSKRQDTPVIRTPGMHHLHYAPVTKTKLIDTENIRDYLQKNHEKIALVTHSEINLLDNIYHVRMPQDTKLYAHELYSALRELDKLHFQCILIESVPNSSDWEAIKDRLAKATGES